MGDGEAILAGCRGGSRPQGMGRRRAVARVIRCGKRHCGKWRCGKWLCHLVVAAMVVLVVPWTGAPAEAEDVARGAIVEPFDRLNTDRWFLSDGWTNGPHQGCRWSADRVQVTGGVLKLTLETRADDPDRIACAEVQTRDPRRYGLYEVRLRAPRGSGVVSGMFTYTGPPLGTPHDEIDVELLGKSARTVQLNYFVDGEGGHEAMETLHASAIDSFNTYGFQWLADRIRWFVNGDLVREVAHDPLPRTPGRIMLSLWNGTDASAEWLGSFSPPRAPIAAEVDWFVYTPPGEFCLIEQSVSCDPGFTW